MNTRNISMAHRSAGFARQPLGQLVLVTLLCAGNAQAADEDRDPLLRLPDIDVRMPDLPELPVGSAWSWLETRRDDVSRNVSGAGRYLDDWLSGAGGVGERSNQSYLRLKVNQQVSETGAYYSNLRLSGRIDLPQASERWKLIFESEQTDLESLQNQRLSNIRPNEVTGAFSYELPGRDDGFRFTHDLGIKGRIPLDPFYRFKTRYGRDINENWFFGVDHRIWYYHTDGWGQDARFYFSRIIREDMFLHIDTDINYRDQRNQFEYAQTVALHQSLGELETLSYEAGIIGMSKPNPRVENYYVQSVYRKAIYEEWLVMELVPQLIMEREESWDPDPRFQFNLEIYFFDF